MSKSKNKRKEPVQCKICNATVQRRSLNLHLRTHEEGRFPCDICEAYKGKRQCDLQNHKKVVHNVGKESINDCPFCKKKLTSMSKLVTHLRSHTRERPYFCKFCPKECSTTNGSIEHQRRSHSLKREPAVHCHICSTKILDKRSLLIHLKIHLVPVEDLPFKCDVCSCSKAFRNKADLNRHKRVHSKEKPFPCEICNVAFSRVDHLNTHMRIHTGEKPYACKICPMRFYRQDALNIHLIAHTGEKPYACTVCTRRFSYNENLKSHMRTHSGEKPHACKECNKAYADKRSLQSHLKRFHS